MKLLRQFAFVRAKKGIALVVALLMLVSNTGFAMTVHYCGGKISSISSGYSNKETCEIPKAAEKICCGKPSESDPKAKEDSHKKCCSDKTVSLKGKAIDVIVKMASVDFVAPFIIPDYKPIVFGYEPTTKAESLTSYYCDAHAPPLFKLYHQYIFYA